LCSNLIPLPTHICETLGSSSPCVRITTSDIPVDMFPHLYNDFSVRQGHPADVAALCAGPVDLDLHNKNGDTPLYVALKEIDDTGKRFEIIKELLSCGAECKQCVIPYILVRHSVKYPQDNARRAHTIGICTKSISFGSGPT
jgi:ankyrin repeat protein